MTSAATPRPKPSVRPVVVWLGAAIVGIFLASLVALPPLTFYIAAGVASIVAMLLPQRRALPALLLLALPFLFFGFARGRDALSRDPDDISAYAGGPSVRVEGVVDDEPQLQPGRGGSVAVGLTLRVSAVETYGRFQPANGRLHTTLTQIEPPLPMPGDTLRVRGRVTLPPGVRNPNGFDYRAFLARHGINATLVARRTADVVSVPGATHEWSDLGQLAHSLRTALLASFRAHLNADDAALLSAVTLSTRSGLPADLTDALARDGALYILSTSGLHLAALALSIAWILRRLSVPHRFANLVAIGLLWLFVLASGANVAALRAGITLTILLFAPVVSRSAEPLHSLAVAAFVILAFDPLALFDAGFQLSFATIATLLFYLPPLEALVLPWEPGRPWGKRWLRKVAQGLLAGIVAQIGCDPLTAYYFNQLSLYAPVATVVLAPLSVLLLFAGTVAAGLSTILPMAVATLLWFGIHLSIAGLRGIAFLFARLPGCAMTVASPEPFWIVVYYLVLGGCAPFVRRKILQKRFFAPQIRDFGNSSGADSVAARDSLGLSTAQ